MNYEEITKRVNLTSGFIDIRQEANKVSLYDEIEDKFITFKNLKAINYLDLFDFSSIQVDSRKFLKIINLLDKKLFMKVKRFIF